METVQDIIRAVRNIRSKMNIAVKHPLAALVSSKDVAVRAAVGANAAFIAHLANLSELTAAESVEKPPHSAAEVVGQTEVFVPLEGLIDLEAERARLEGKLADVRGKLEGVERKLANEAFVLKAPAEIVERERAKKVDLEAQAETLERNLGDLA
jgi:valyl-tRNA synthetase